MFGFLSFPKPISATWGQFHKENLAQKVMLHILTNSLSWSCQYSVTKFFEWVISFCFMQKYMSVCSESGLKSYKSCKMCEPAWLIKFMFTE